MNEITQAMTRKDYRTENGKIRTIRVHILVLYVENN